MPSVILWSSLLDFGRHKYLQTFTCLLKNTRSNLAQLNTNPFPQSCLGTSLLEWDTVHPGSWSQLRCLQKTLTQTTHDSVGEVAGERAASFQREGTLRSSINTGQKNLISQIIPVPTAHFVPKLQGPGCFQQDILGWTSITSCLTTALSSGRDRIARALLLSPPTF